MGLVLVPNEVRNCISMMKSYLGSSVRCYLDILQKIEEYVADNELCSTSWEQSKETMHICYQVIAMNMLSVQDSFFSDMNTLDGAIGDEYLDEDELQSRIALLEAESQQYENSITQMTWIAQTFSWTCLTSTVSNIIEAQENLIAVNEAEIARLKEKIIFLHEVEDSTVNLFQSVIDTLIMVSNAIHDGGVVLSGGTDFLGSELLTVPKYNIGVECKKEIDIFEQDLIKQGFPEGYRKYLMKLHEKYPEWRFEAVITGVDYQDFVNYQINNELKCAEISSYDFFCTNRQFSGEKSQKYRVANEKAIMFFSNPYCLLQMENGVMQFMKAEQDLPQEYVDLVVPQILKGKDKASVDAISKNNNRINPVFMACIYKMENGPSGENYRDKKVYNFFNIGAYTGKEDALKYAYEKQWFTPEACIQGSDIVFQKYIESGQDTLYALDWDYKNYARVGSVRQYATLVNDAYEKAQVLVKFDEQMCNLDYNFVFKIPVYENMLSYDEQEYTAFMDYVCNNM